MKAIKCEMCSSNDVVKRGEYFVCQNCGTKYEPEAAKKLMVEVDNSKALENLYILARRARDIDNSEEAEKYYSKILEINPNDWEAYFFTAYFKALQSKQAYIASAANEVDGAVAQTVNLLLESGADEEEVTEAALAMYARVPALAATFGSNAISIQQQYYTISYSAGKQNELNYQNMLRQSCNLLSNFGGYIDCLAKRYPNNAELRRIVVDSSKSVFNVQAFDVFLPRATLLARIREYEASFSPPTGSYPSAASSYGFSPGIVIFIVVCLIIATVCFVYASSI